jgi:spermidine synthase
LTPEAAISVQSTAPMFARNSYWCIIRTLEAAGLSVKPYYTAVPSFGLWGFALARSSPFETPTKPPDGLRFLDEETLASMFQLSKDIEPVPVEINRLDNQALVRYYEGEWKRFE